MKRKTIDKKGNENSIGNKHEELFKILKRCVSIKTAQLFVGITFE